MAQKRGGLNEKNFKQLIATIGLFSLLLTGCSSNNNFSNNNLLPNEPDPVAWINKDGIKYYYFISELDIDENSLYYTGEKTDSDDAIEVGKRSTKMKLTMIVYTSNLMDSGHNIKRGNQNNTYLTII